MISIRVLFVDLQENAKELSVQVHNKRSTQATMICSRRSDVTIRSRKYSENHGHRRALPCYVTALFDRQPILHAKKVDPGDHH